MVLVVKGHSQRKVQGGWLSPTHVISFYVWYGQLFCNVLSNGTFATTSRAGDDPHVAVVMGGQGSMDLLDRGRGCVVHG